MDRVLEQQVMSSHDVRRTLVLPIPPLDLLVFPLLYFALENAGTLWLVKPCDFEDLRRVHPPVGTATHDGDTLAHPVAEGQRSGASEHEERPYISYTGIPLYVAWGKAP